MKVAIEDLWDMINNKELFLVDSVGNEYKVKRCYTHGVSIGRGTIRKRLDNTNIILTKGE